MILKIAKLSILILSSSFLQQAYCQDSLENKTVVKRPNIFMIMVDDLNDWVGVYGGHPQVKTPHIDKFAQKAMVFRNASCAGPVCGPSSSSMLSGFMPATTGVYGNNNNMMKRKKTLRIFGQRLVR